MTIEQLKANLYIENLREQYKERDFWFTKICELKWNKACAFIENQKRKAEEKLMMSDEDFLKAELHEHTEDYAQCGDLLTRDLKNKYQKQIEGSAGYMERRKEKIKEKDYIYALFYSYMKKKYPHELNFCCEVTVLKDIYLHVQLPLNIEMLTDEVVADYCKSTIFESKFVSLLFPEVESYLNDKVLNDSNALEIDTKLIEGSTKFLSKPIEVDICNLFNKLHNITSRANVLSDWNKEMFGGKKYSTIVCNMFRFTEVNENEFNHRFDCLLSALNNSGKIILFDDQNISKPEMYSVRKRMIDNNMLTMYVSGSGTDSDIYILTRKENRYTSMIDMIGDYKGYNSFHQNAFSFHKKMTQEEIASLDYNFDASNDLLQGSEGEGYSISEILSIPKSGVEKLKVNDKLHVFQKKNISTDLDDFVCASCTLDVCNISGVYTKVTQPKIVISIENSNMFMTYLVANQENPAYVGSEFVIMDVNTEKIIPEYIVILGMRGVFKELMSMEGEYIQDSSHYDIYLNREFEFTKADMISQISYKIQLPEKSVQEKEINDVLFIKATASKRERALEALLERRTWLNEKHIRTIKHRIGHELCPVVNDIQQLQELFKKHNGTLSLDTMYGKSGHVSDIIDRLSKGIVVVNESLKDLTKDPKEKVNDTIDINAFLRVFCQKYQNGEMYKLEGDLPESSFDVVGNSECISNLLFEIIHNACRHGFVNRSKEDNKIRICLEPDCNKNVILSVMNNGYPMSELGEKNYFLRGMVAGKTGHSGNGGADVKDIADSVGADVSLANDRNCMWPVCVRISFPIINRK